MTENYNIQEAREARFRELYRNLPNGGDVLQCLNGIPASVHVENLDGDVQLFTYAVIDDDRRGWFLELSAFGVVVFIANYHHDTIMKNSTPDSEGRPTVEKLRIVRRSLRGTSLIGELVE